MFKKHQNPWHLGLRHITLWGAYLRPTSWWGGGSLPALSHPGFQEPPNAPTYCWIRAPVEHRAFLRHCCLKANAGGRVDFNARSGNCRTRCAIPVVVRATYRSSDGIDDEWCCTPPLPHASGTLWSTPAVTRQQLNLLTRRCTVTGRSGLPGGGRLSAEWWIHRYRVGQK